MTMCLRALSGANPSPDRTVLLQSDDRRLIERLTQLLGADQADGDGGEPTLRIIDCRGDQPPPPLRPGERVVALADTPAQRLLLWARGALMVLDGQQPADELVRQLRRLHDRLADGGDATLDDVDSRAPAMRAVLADARRTARADASLLLTGETGVGKEYLARLVHASGPRRLQPFVVLNCGALPETLLESQLFGHERGAFTGADRSRKGFFELADGGTLLLDEIGEMPLHLQVKLLTVLERRELFRLGAHTPTAIDVRVMAATNRDIGAAVASGAFREDLFYRLNVIHLRLPPLRQRAADLPDIAGRFLCSLGAGADFTGVEPAALQALQAFAWPGNVRELRNTLERGLVLTGGGRIAIGDLPAGLRVDGAAEPAPAAEPASYDGMTLRQVRDAAVQRAERDYLRRLLEQTGGRVGQTAARAGIRPRSLYDRMKQHGLRKEQFRGRR